MRKLSFLLMILSLFTGVLNTYGQEKNESPVSVSMDIMSRYVWRGIDFGASPSIQPGIEYSKGGFVLGAWGAYAISKAGYEESDLYMGYTFLKDMFSVTLTDYFFQSPTSKYFDYDKNKTAHVLETSLSFNGTEKLPLSFMIATNVYGADAKKSNGDIQYSTYAELSYNYKNLTLFAGANLTQPNTKLGETGYYNNKAGIINLGLTATKKVKVTSSYSLPVNVSIITNPLSGKIYFVGGLSF